MKVRNWNKWQSYRRDRGQPPWIKVYRRLLHDPAWASLSDSQRGQLVSVWMLAADRNGALPDDPKTIKKLCHMDGEFDPNPFVLLGFLDAKLAPTRRQHDAPEESRGEERQNRTIALEDERGFIEFYLAYPKRKSKKDALKAYTQALKETSHEKIMAGLERAKKTWRDPKFIPYPASWLRAGGYDDEASGGDDWKRAIFA